MSDTAMMNKVLRELSKLRSEVRELKEILAVIVPTQEDVTRMKNELEAAYIDPVVVPIPSAPKPIWPDDRDI